MASTGVSAYAAINARVRVMYSTLQTPLEWAGMCESPDLATLTVALKRTASGPYLDKVNDKDLTPRRAVFQIKGHLADVYVSIIRMAPEHSRDVLLQMFRYFEVDNLKAVLRGIVTGASWERVRFVLFPPNPITSIPAQAMMEAGGVGPAIELLRETPYYGTLSHAMKRYNAEQNLFPLEVALDLNYWRELWRDANHLPSQDRVPALKIVGSLVDMNNLMWAIRYRVYHKLAEEELINYTLPFGLHVRDSDIRAIAAGADITQVVKRVYPDLRDIDAMLDESGKGLPELELQLKRSVLGLCRAAFTGDPFTIGIPLAYLVLSDFEIQDLTVLIEAKASMLKAEEFQPYLIGGCAENNNN
ncbi:MAG: V-type ATPase subunit [Anaerolineaceae bacterium]|jgi:V/A-type H+-transporting ATPase subunit C